MMSNLLHVADVFRCFLTICCLVNIHGFLPETYNSSELIKTVEISSSGDVLVVTGNRLMLFRNLSISNGDLVYEVKVANKVQPGTSHTDRAEKISFFSFIKSNDKELAIECTSEECFVHDLPDITLYKQVIANSTHFPLMGTLGADRSAEAVFDSCPHGICRIFSAQTTNDGVTYISERYLYVAGDAHSFAPTPRLSSFFQSVSGQNFDFLHSFQGDNFVYFLRNVRQETGESHAIISQMCTKDSSFRSYMESKLECGGYSHLLTATTTNTADGMVMFASFSLRPFIDDVTDTSESVICTYRVSELADYFDRTLTDCFRHTRGYWPEWIDDIGESCSKESSKSLYKCGHTNSNTRIVSNTTLQMKFIKPKYHYENVVSMVMRQHGTRTLGYFGTQEGEIIKVLFNATTNKIERALKLEVSNVPVRHVTLSKDGSSIFYISGNSVGKVPLNTCGIHNDCYSCMMAKLHCVWSTDRLTGRDGLCVPESDVSKHVNNQHEAYCRPIVYGIEPRSGPTGGGTTVTISGQLDIPAWYGASYPNDQVYVVPVEVQLGQTPCRVVSLSHFPNKLECVTAKELQPTNKLLRVTIHNVNIDTANTHKLIRSQGMAVNKPTFNFLEPTINNYTEITRQRVRLSGGIQITIYGENLDIGNQHSKRITIGQKNCIITKYDRVLSGSVTCQAPAQSDPVECDIFYTIDNNTIRGRSSVVYISDPIIADIQPRSSIVSGGVHLTISGENLQGLGRNGVMLNIDILDQGEYETITSECTLEDRNTFVCPTSPAPLHDGLPLYGQANLYNVYGELVSLNISVYIVPDPTMEREDKLMESSPEIQLFYSGEGLQNISIGDVRLLVGDKPCQVTEINNTGITCMIQDLSDVEIGLREKVECQIGLRTYDLGTVAFQDTDPQMSRIAPSTSDTTEIVMTSLKILGGAILGVMVLGTVVFGIRRKCEATRTRKNERLSVHFRNRRVLNLQGLSENVTPESQQNNANDYVENGLQRQDAEVTDVKETCPLLLDEEALDMFERKHLLIPSERLVVGETIGQGNFGCVYKGYLQQPEEKSERIVACKTLQRNKPREMDVSTFLKEALIMKDFHHKNVMELVGICLGIEKLPLVVLPFMRMGDVLSYIRNVENVPTVKDLVVFAVDIANGMYYLSQLKFVHRDLAARNCMIDEDMTVKVADFGLSRDVYEKEYYSSSDKKAQLPVKWMSPESLELGLFTTKSDVWSFGVVLWELLTRGVNPYPTVDNWDILRYLKGDRRLNKPDFCPEEMYRTMQSCWQWNANDRPTFGDLTVSIPERLRRLEKASERRKQLASLSEERERNDES